MIRINLLGEETVADRSGLYLVAGYGASVIGLLIVFFFMISSIQADIDDTSAQAQLLEAQLKKLKEVTKEVKDLEIKKKELKDKLAVLARLKRNKIGPVHVMDDLNKALPERAWLSEVREKDDRLYINGMALDDQTIATFMRELDASDYFETIDLVHSRKTPYKGVRISEFAIDAKVNYTGKLKNEGAVAQTQAEKPPAEKPSA